MEPPAYPDLSMTSSAKLFKRFVDKNWAIFLSGKHGSFSVLLSSSSNIQTSVHDIIYNYHIFFVELYAVHLIDLISFCATVIEVPEELTPVS